MLLDTHLLLWAGYEPDRLSAEARALIGDEANTPLFSAISIAEVAMKSALGRSDFRIDAQLLRRQLIANDYLELPLDGAHAAAVAELPAIHKDPFDRLLLAQARTEAVPLLTADADVARYVGLARLV